MAKSQLSQLAEWTVIVEDTGDIEKIRIDKPQDATTNPSLVYQAAQQPKYKNFVDEAVSYANTKFKACVLTERLEVAMDKLACLFGCEISKAVPGYVSTEVDARLSFDTEGSIRRAKQIIAMYEEMGVPKERILIKLATTWEMILACESLEKEGIKTNMTLLFSKCQAIAAAQKGATLISPFVGRILDWYKKSTGRDSYAPEEDPGVLSVKDIYKYYKAHGINTIVMGASFRSKEEIIELAGCDRLTIAPAWLEALTQCEDPIERKLDPASCTAEEEALPELDEKTFRWMLNGDAMATEKLAEGIRGFSADIKKLEDKLVALLEA